MLNHAHPGCCPQSHVRLMSQVYVTLLKRQAHWASEYTEVSESEYVAQRTQRVEKFQI